MEFADAILILLYLVAAAALASVGWSLYRRYRKGSGRQPVQNGIAVRRLTGGVWLGLFALAAASFLLFRGEPAASILTLLTATLAITLLVVAWSMLRHR